MLFPVPVSFEPIGLLRPESPIEAAPDVEASIPKPMVMTFAIALSFFDLKAIHLRCLRELLCSPHLVNKNPLSILSQPEPGCMGSHSHLGGHGAVPASASLVPPGSQPDGCPCRSELLCLFELPLK